MLTIEKIDTNSNKQVARFVKIPFQFYKDCPQWVPPIRVDIANSLNRGKHPFFEHSDGDFFIAVRDGKDVGRLAILENRRFNVYHGTRKAQFYYFESEEVQETASALFERAFDWAKSRNLDTVLGPKGLGPLDGYGMLVEGFDHRQMMTMMNYNHPYLPRFLEAIGFEKEVDFVSCYVSTDTFRFPERIHSIAERVQQRGTLKVKRFTDKRDLISWAPRIGQAYNKAFVNNWEYYPLTEREIDFVVSNIMTVANPKLIKIILHGEDVVGFLFAFPDISAALQRSGGRLLPFGIFDLLLEMKRTKWVSVNGTGILPEFQGRGGNALMYSEMEKTVRGFGFEHADLTQVAETAVQMRSDLMSLGGKAYKNHRVYRKKI
jgi:GNAT superfamily N-acetyltransferase